MTILKLDNLSTSYGLSKALFGVSLEISKGELVSLIGRNGVGKTTAMRSIMGLTQPNAGKVYWKGVDITGRSPNKNARDGIGFVPEDRRIFSDLTVWENLDVARQDRPDYLAAWNEERIFELFPDLLKLQNRKGGLLSGGEQQMLTIARTLMGNPELLLLDEPSEGLAPLIVKVMRDKIIELKKIGITIILAEQSLDLVLSVSDKIYVLEKGKIVLECTPDYLCKNKKLQNQYLSI